MKEKSLYYAARVDKNEESLGGFMLEYYLLTSERKAMEPKYSIEVELKWFDKDNGTAQKGRFKRNFSSMKMAEIILELFHNNLVTPAHVHDLELDMFGRQYAGA